MPVNATIRKLLHSSRATTILSAIIIIVAVFSFYYKPNYEEKMSGFDNMEWYEEAQERDTLAKVFDYNYYSGRQTPGSYFNPIQLLVWQRMITRFGDYRYPYLVLGIILQSINALLVLCFAQLFIKNKYLSLAAAMSFALYYPNYQTMDWISAIITVGIAALLFISTFLLLVHFFLTNKKIYYIASLITFAIGILTKEYVVFALPLIFLYYIIFQRKSVFAVIKKDLILLPYVFISLPLILITLYRLPQSFLISTWGGFNFSFHMLYRFVDYLIYITTVIPLSFHSKAVAAAIIFFAIPTVVFFCRKDKNLLFLLLSLALFIGIFVYTNFRDIYELSKYIYIPSIAWFTFLYCAASKIKNNRMKILTSFLLINYTITFNIFLILSKT